MCTKILCDNAIFLHWLKGYCRSQADWPMDEANKRAWLNVVSYIQEQIATHEKDKERGEV